MSAKLPEIRLALSVDFLEAFAAIPRRQQAHVRQFIEQFRRNPTATGLNYEVIRNSRDPNLRSVRIDGAYRAIVLKPETGNTYALLWVDNHDDAYAWAQNRRVRIDPATGGIQILSVETTTEAASAAAPVADVVTPTPPERELEARVPQRALFDEHGDDVLRRFGLPDEFLPAVRGLRSEDDLDELQPRLPAEVYEALFYMAAGYGTDEIWEMVSGAPTPPPAVDPTDFSAAFDNPQTLRRFTVVDGDEALAAILDAPLATWRVFLHPSQRRHAEHRKTSGPVRVLGGAGTGKTVVAMHRVRFLAEKVFTGADDRILFTTFTGNLATDIRANLAHLCPPATRARIEVVHFDKWVRDFLAREGFAYRIVYDGDADRERAWQHALWVAPRELALAPGFYREEFVKIVVPQGLTDVTAYFKAPRLGRGTALGRRERAAIWSVFETYRRNLAEARLIEAGDAMREARLLLASKGAILPYRAVVVDEAQDLGAQAFMLLRQIVPAGENDLFIVGDAHQRIFGQQVVLSRCGVQVRGRAVTLKINYRTTEEIRQWAVKLVAGRAVDDLEGGLDETRGYKSLLHGNAPDIRGFRTLDEEVAFLASQLSTARDEPGGLAATCLVARTKKQVEQYRGALAERGFPGVVLDAGGDLDSHDGFRLATIHRVKGLEFERVLIAGANAGVLPLAAAVDGATDETMRAERELAERSLLYVAATRAKRHAVITSHGTPSPFLA